MNENAFPPFERKSTAEGLSICYAENYRSIHYLLSKQGGRPLSIRYVRDTFANLWLDPGKVRNVDRPLPSLSHGPGHLVGHGHGKPLGFGGQTGIPGSIRCAGSGDGRARWLGPGLCPRTIHPQRSQGVSRVDPAPPNSPSMGNTIRLGRGLPLPG